MINEKNANTDKKRPELKFNRFEILKKTPPPLVEKLIKSFNKKLSNKKNVKIIKKIDKIFLYLFL